MVKRDPVAGMGDADAPDRSGPPARAGAVVGLALVLLGIGLVAGVPAVVADTHLNETLHEHPDEVGADGDVVDVADWLGGSLGEMLGNSAVEISEAEYELARSYLGDEYDQRLEEYVDVQGETGRESDSEAVESFERAQREQARYVDLIEEYEETFEAFETALDAGNNETARTHARRLEELMAELDVANATLQEEYGLLSDLVPADFTEPSMSVASSHQETRETHRAVEEIVFVATRVEDLESTDRASFRDPLVVSGAVVDEAGQPVSTGRALVTLGNDTATTSLQPDGSFSLALRPVHASPGRQNATVAFEPPPASEYRGAETTVPVVVEQVSPTVRIDEAPRRTAFGEDVPIQGAVTVAGEPVAHVPFRATLGGTTLVTGTTDEAGRVNVTQTMGTEPGAGDHQLSIRLATEGTAIAPAEVASTVVVEPTETVVTVSADGDTDESLSIAGELMTVDGRAVPAQTIEVYVDGDHVVSTRTRTGGGFDVAAEAAEGDTREPIEVMALYEAPGTNLADATASTTVTPSGRVGWVDAAMAATAVTLLVLLGLFGYLGYRRDGWPAVSSGRPFVGAISTRSLRDWWRGRESPAIVLEPEEEPRDGVLAEGRSRRADLLADARDRQQAGAADAAIQLAYVAVRGQLRAHLADGRGATHWEFLAQYRDAVPGSADDLASLTELYERAEFAPTTATREDAGLALRLAERVADAPGPSSVDVIR